jgi:hypothetical protein
MRSDEIEDDDEDEDQEYPDCDRDCTWCDNSYRCDYAFEVEDDEDRLSR